MRSLALFAWVALCACSGAALAQNETPVNSGAAADAAEAAAATTEAPPVAATDATKPAEPKDAAQPAAAADAGADAAKPAAESAGAGEAPRKYQPPRGYKAEIRVADGEKVYCRSEDVIGTRFTRKVCYSEIELEQVRARNESEANDVTRRSRVCSSASACASN